MNKKYTYKPTSSVKYGKGGKNKKNKKKTYRSDGKHYDAQWGWISDLVDPIAGLLGIGSMMDTLGGDTFEADAAAAGGVYGMGETMQDEAAGTGAEMATDISSILGFDPANLASVDTLQDQIDNIGIAKPKKVSTEFVEGIKDTIGQQTAGVLSDIGRTGKMAGIRDVMQSTDQALIGAQEKAAGMDERYEGQLVDIDKFETGQTSQLVGQQAQQQFGAATSEYGLAGDLASQSAAAGGDLSASAISGIIELQGQSQAAWADLIGGGVEAVIGLFDFGWEKGGKVPKVKAEKGAKMQEYEEGAKQDGEKIGEMTGGEAIMPPKDVAEFEQLILEKDKNGVFNKLKSLFIKWDQKAREHEEKNMDQKAMAGARMGYMPKSKINYR